MSDAQPERCLPCEGNNVIALSHDELHIRMLELPDWLLDADERGMSKTFSFVYFHQVMAFVNAVAWIAHQYDHHPEMVVSYRLCTVHFSTHAVNGLTHNDFVCALQVEALFRKG